VSAAEPAGDDRKLAFRRCVAAFPTGVAVVTSQHRGVPAGMTLNSFTSISLDPLLVLVSLAHGSRTLDAVRRSGRYAVSILQRGQRQVAIDFAKRSEPFPELYVRRDDGFLLVRHALAHLHCEVDQLVAAGDHDLALGRVGAFTGDPGDPLVFHASQFGGVHVDAEAPAGFDLIDDEGVGW
jgi:flavin reductase (DIM6/NTAB) family NADH-FMN oxidoreductase RutF